MPDYKHTNAHKTWGWNGKINLVNGYTRKNSFYYKKDDFSFSLGLLPKALAILDKHDIRYNVIDDRVFPDNRSIKFHGDLRAYQVDMVNNLLDKKCVTWAVATGGGKSYSIAAAVAELNVPTMIYVGTKDLLDQMVDNLKDALKRKIGKIGDGECDIQKFTVCTWQSAASALNLKKIFDDEKLGKKEKVKDKLKIVEAIRACQFLVVDEAHHAACEMVQGIVAESKNAVWKLGASATPHRDRGDDLLIQAELGDISNSISASDLMKMGYLVPECNVFYRAVPNIGMPMPKNYHSSYSQLIVNNGERNKMIFDIALQDYRDGRKILIIVDQKDAHGKKLHEMIGRAIPKTKFVSGKTKTAERKKTMQDARDGKVNCLIATSLADEGLDIPILSSLILAAGKKSRNRTIQRAGRVLRKHHTKKSAVIHDFWDNGYYISDHSKERMKVFFSQEAFNVKCEKDEDLIKIARNVKREVLSEST